MSWGEVKKINSDLETSLTILYWLKDYQKFGSNGYVWKDPNKKAIIENILGVTP